MAEYFLPHHIHFCCRQESLVFLDLRRDDYVLVNGNIANVLRNISAQSQTSLDAIESKFTELLRDGLLTTDSNAGRAIAPTRIDLAMNRLVSPDAPLTGDITLGHFIHFVAACTIAAIRLRWNPLGKVVKAIEQRKRGQASMSCVDLVKARELTTVFIKLRFFFPRNYLCLYDSLALIEFLARYQLFPTWIFGVRLEPWDAHCWVQEGEFTFNECVEVAANYTPIMAI